MDCDAPAVAPVKAVPKLRVAFYDSYSALIARLAQAFPEKGDVLQLSGIPFRVFCFRHPEHIKQIYTDKTFGSNKLPSLLPRVRWIMGEGSFIHPGGPGWKRRRYLLQPALTHQSSLKFASAGPGVAERVLARWQDCADTGRPVDLHRELGYLIFAATFQSLFSEDVWGEIEEVYEQTHFLLQAFGERVPLWLPTPRNFRFRRVARRMQQRVRAMVERRIHAAERPDDLLTLMLTTPDKETGQTWAPQEVQDEVFSLYFGASIVRVGLSWVFFLLSLHPAVRRTLEQEVDGVLQGRPPTVHDLPRLRYTDMVFQETVRLYPPVWGYPRYTAEPVEIGGYHFPRKSLLLPVGYFAHRHPDFWDNPEGFDPERFAPERVSRIHPFAHYPFGGGPRMCLGRNLAPPICQLVIASIVQRYELRLAPRFPGDPLPHFGFELGPRDRLMMTVHRRRLAT